MAAPACQQARNFASNPAARTPMDSASTGLQSTASLPLLSAPPLARRMACWLYEGVLMFGVVFIAGYLYGTLTQTRNALDHRHGLQLFVFLVCGIYFVWFWHQGQTLAMKTWHIRMVDRLGRPLTQARALLRYVLAWVWFIPPLLAMAPFHLDAGTTAALFIGWVLAWALLSRLRSDRQFWHDVWAGSRLIDVRPRPGEARP